MHTALAFGNRHTLYAVRATFKFHIGPGEVATHENNDLVDATQRRKIERKRFALPPLVCRIGAVHLEQVCSKEVCLFATLGSTNFYNDIFSVVCITWQQEHFEFSFKRQKFRFCAVKFFAKKVALFAHGLLHELTGGFCIATRFTHSANALNNGSHLLVQARGIAQFILIANNVGVAKACFKLCIVAFYAI